MRFLSYIINTWHHLPLDYSLWGGMKALALSMDVSANQRAHDLGPESILHGAVLCNEPFKQCWHLAISTILTCVQKWAEQKQSPSYSPRALKRPICSQKENAFKVLSPVICCFVPVGGCGPLLATATDAARGHPGKLPLENFPSSTPTECSWAFLSFPASFSFSILGMSVDEFLFPLMVFNRGVRCH